MSDLYQDLLKTLDSDEKLKVAPTVTKHGHRRFEINHKQLKKPTYEREEVESFIGFAVSIIASMAANTSLSVMVALTNPERIMEKFAKYKKLAGELDKDMGDETEELSLCLAETTAMGIEKIIDSDDDEKPDVTDTASLNSMVASVITCYLLGRNAQFFAEKLGSETMSTHEKVEFLTTAVRQAYNNKELITGGLAERVSDLIETMLDDDIVQRVESGTAEFSELQELMQRYVNGSQSKDE